MNRTDVGAGPGVGSPTRPLASAPHGVTLLAGLLALSVAGAVWSPIAEWPETLAGPRSRLLLYARVVALQWIWVVYVQFGMRRSGTPLRALLGTPGFAPRRWLRYLAIGVAGWIFWLAAGAGLGAVLRPSAEELAGLAAMLPKTPAESGTWVLFALTAGIAEELVYRGYLLRQLHAWSGNVLVALPLQAIFYALAHLVLPVEMVISVGLLGLLLGALAVWQKSLVPGMILHTAVGLTPVLMPGT